MNHLKCPHCGAGLTEDNFGRELVTEPIHDLLGQEIHSHRIGNCYHCWEVVELVNGQIAFTLLIPPDWIQETEP